MASVSPRPSPNSSSPYDFESPESDEHWQWIDYGAGSAPSSVGFFSDPASGSLNSFGVIGHVQGGNGLSPSPSAASPLLLGEVNQQQNLFQAGNVTFTGTSEPASTDVFPPTSTAAASFVQPAAGFMTPQQYLFQAQESGQISPQAASQFSPQDLSQFSPQDLNQFSPQDPSQFPPQDPTSQFSQQELNDMAPFMGTFTTDMFPANQEIQQQGAQLELELRQPLQSDPNVPPWNPANPRAQEPAMFTMEDFNTPSPNGSYSPTASSPGSRTSSSSGSKSPSQIRKVRDGKIKKKSEQQGQGQFVVVTPNSISAHAGRPNPFECFDLMRTSQRGRKGPLANATKEEALQVRRLGACFCCHSRKVKCDKERPCKSCKKLMISVPQVVCWQFSDFIPILFPVFIRDHFRKEEMTKFITENIDGFSPPGVPRTCAVELFSGPLFNTVYSIEAKFFTPKTCDVIQHYHMSLGTNMVSLQSNGSAPIGLELQTAAERDGLKKKSKKYVQDIMGEVHFVDQLTDSFHWTQLPKKILRIVKEYADATDSVIVKRALSIYTMHYIMTRHLCLTRGTIDSLAPTGLVSQNDNRMTPRVLARQIKSTMDELMQKEMQSLFDLFSKSLKPKSRREWAPCLSAFLVLCLFMEAVESAADTFVVSENEVSMRNNSRVDRIKRTVALNTCKEVENMPFKQFAYQFHQVYQTHSKEANAKSFNPLFDRSFGDQGELDGPAIRLAAQLQEMFFGEDWLEIQYLFEDDILPNRETHPYPRDPQMLYTGRLVAKFLMSFVNDKAIFGE